MRHIQIRSARPDESDALSALCRRAKAHWGYDAEFLRLSETSLTIAPSAIADDRVRAAEADGALLGVASIEALSERGAFDLAHCFVEPRAMGRGVGRKLFETACGLARARGGVRLVILSDPFAEAFYRRLGAVRIGEAPSDAIRGRMLPLLEFVL
jgi:GNAT superfamily N-acetyltransferase